MYGDLDNRDVHARRKGLRTGGCPDSESKKQKNKFRYTAPPVRRNDLASGFVDPDPRGPGWHPTLASMAPDHIPAKGKHAHFPEVWYLHSKLCPRPGTDQGVGRARQQMQSSVVSRGQKSPDAVAFRSLRREALG
jgi:hypothetical protein